MDKKIEHSFPLVGKEEKKMLLDVIESSFLAQGLETGCFEKEMAHYIGTKYAVASSTGTAALHLALLALNIKAGDEVIIPNYVCRSVLNAVQYCRAKPVLCDVEVTTGNILPAQIKRKLNRRTKAVIIAHMFGCPADMDELKKIDVPLIEDCAQSIGAEFNGRRVGGFGDLSVFSFEGTKTITTGEGGMVLTNSRRIFERLRKLKEPSTGNAGPKYTYRMSDLQAAVGRAQLKKLPGFIIEREKIARKYMKAFNRPEVILPFIPFNTRHIFHRFLLTIKSGNIEKFLAGCQKEGVLVKKPLKPYTVNRFLNISAKLFPASRYIMNHSVSVPIYPALTKNDIIKIIKVISGQLDRMGL